VIPAIGKTGLAAAYVLASLSCPPQKPVETVSLYFTNNPPVITNDQPASFLGQFSISTTFSRSHNEIFTVGGLHITDFAPKYLVSFNLDSGLEGGKVCLAPAAISIAVNYSPRIMVASEHKPGTCQYKTILDHEMRHVGIDVITLNEYLPQMKKAIEEAARLIKPIGPMPPSSIEKAKNIIVDAVQSALVAQVEEFELIRLNRQKMIDTRQEYLRLSKVCQ